MIFAAFAVAVLWTSCSNDFEVAAPWQDIPIVYGLVDVNADMHYIRVEKAFLDPDADALELAKIPDSLYYDDLTVTYEVDGTVYNLEKVNGADINVGLPRDVGIFANEPNWLYRINAATINLAQGDTVKLAIDRGNSNLPLVTAKTVVQGPGRLRTPDPTLPTPPRLDFSSRLPEQIKWQSSEDARIFDVTVFLNYAEFPKDNPDSVKNKTIEWVWAKGLRVSRPENVYDAEVETSEFFDVMANNITADPNMFRFFVDCEVRIVSGGEDFDKYVSVAVANSGVTGSQEPPSYTNLSEGLGVFSSINTISQTGVLLSQPTLDSLRENPVTVPLNFQ